jgi:hypothetical protein
MALSLSIKQPSGVTASYWKVSKMHIDNINLRIVTEIGGYIDQPTYASGALPVVIVIEIMNSTQYTQILSSTNLISEFYTLLSQMPNFSGSAVVP